MTVDAAMDEHPIAQQIQALLEDNGCVFHVSHHPPVRTSEEAAAMRAGYTLRQGAKAIILRAKVAGQGDRFSMLVFPADKRFDSSKVKQLLNAKDIRFATEEEVDRLTGGVKPGGVPPFGNLFGLPVFSDEAIFENREIIFNAGRTTSIAMQSADYRRLAQPLVCDIVSAGSDRL
ncbi:MAG TPA: YbaK/EbsC family protein [Spirochaetia bacterium]|nr:YbaK/EbsC family protein [Spirochaetia bacterium]